MNITVNITNETIPEFTHTMTAESGYSLPSNVTVSGATSTWNQSTGILGLTNPTSTISYSVNGIKEGSLSLGSLNISKMFLGTSEVDKVYWGSTKIYQKVIRYSLASTFTNLTITNVDVNNVSVGTTIPANVTSNDALTITFTAATGYTLPSSITVNGQTVSENVSMATYGNCAAEYTTYQGTGTLSLEAFTGNSSCTASGSQAAYTVMSSLWHCTMTSILYNSTSIGSLPSTVNYGDSLSIEFSADTYYTMLNGVYSGTMGSTSLTNYFWYDSVTDKLILTIASIDGNISFNVASDPLSYTLTSSISDLTVTSGTIPSSVNYSDTVVITFVASSGYTLPTSVTVNGYSVPENTGTTTYGNCAADYGTYQDVGTLTLAQFVGNTTINASGEASPQSDHIILDQFSYSSGVNISSILQLSGWDLTATVTNGTANVINPPLGDGTAKLQIVPGTGYAQPSSLDSVTAGVTYSYDSNTGFWSFGNISSDVSVTATCPVRMYTIPAGVYQANSTSTLSDASGTTTINMTFTANGNTYSSLTYEDIDGSTFYINYGNTHVASGTYNGSVTFSDTDNETITLTNDVSVVLAQYNAFYSCYAAYVEPYIIPAGMYYGKARPNVSEFSALAGSYIAYSSNGQNFTGFGVYFGQGGHYMRYVGSSTVDAWSYESRWASAYRAIEITSDVTVQEYEYNVFFAAFDYGFSVNGNVYYGYTTLDMTWSSFVESSNNTYAAFSVYGSGGQNVMCIDDPEYNIDYAIVEPPTPNNTIYWNGYQLLDANYNPVSASDTIIHSHDYWGNSGGSNN